MNNQHIQDFIHFMMFFHRLGEGNLSLTEFGLSPAQVVYIDQLAQSCPCSLKILTEELGFRPASVSVMIAELEQKGLVSKSQDPQDGRAVLLNLTAEGRAIFAQIEKIRRQKAEQLLQSLSEDEQLQLLSLLRKVTKNNNMRSIN